METIDLLEPEPRGGAEVWPPFSGFWPDLARYVAPTTVASLGLGDPESHLRRSTLAPREANRAIARRLYENLVARAVPYGTEPFLVDPVAPQIIRHPDELDVDAGTCVDFAILFASLCLRERLAPVLVVGHGGTLRDGSAAVVEDHVIVALDLDRFEQGARESRLLDAMTRGGGAAGLDHDRAAGDLGSGRFLLIDPTAAARTDRGSLPFSEAVASAEMAVASTSARRVASLGRWSFHAVTWIDVLTVQGLRPPYAPLPAGQRPILTRRSPLAGRFEELEGRQGLREKLGAAVGTIALVGEPGVGKSMLALQLAGAFGWFLNASSVDSLRGELALAESRQQRGTERLEIGVLDELDLADQARARLASTRVPWVVVLDNANLADGAQPGELLDLLPVPQPVHGQRIVVTSTHEAWLADPRVDVPEPLGRLSDEALGMPEGLKVGGRPLFATAFRRLADSQQIGLEALAELAAGAARGGEGAEDVLWACALELPVEDDVIRLARFAAWSAVDEISADALVPGAGVPAAAFAMLLASGLVEPAGTSQARMHRMVARAIRTQSASSSIHDTVGTVATVLGSAIVLDREALALARELEQELSDRSSDRALSVLHGRLAHGLGSRLEPVAGVKAAKPFFERARGLLDPGEVRGLADCLHAAVRYVFQFEKTAPRLAEALLDVERCVALRARAVRADTTEAGAPRHGVLVEEQRTLALRGLVKVALAAALLEGHPPPGPDARQEALTLAREGGAEINESYRCRLETLGISPSDVDVLRARFNQGNLGVNLAKLEPDPVRRARHLDQAAAAYADVRDARETMRPKVRPHLASCHAGLALVDFLRAVPLEGAGLSPVERNRLLRSATAHLDRAALLRQEMEEVDEDEMGKTLFLATKISLARLTVALGDDTLTKELNRLRADLGREVPRVAGDWWPTLTAD